MARLGVETYAGYTRCHHCGIYDSDPYWCDLCGMRKESRGPVDRKRRGAACVPHNGVFLSRPEEALVAGRASDGEQPTGGGHAIG